MKRVFGRRKQILAVGMVYGLALVFSGCHHSRIAQFQDTGKSSFAFVEPPPVPPRKGTVSEASDGPLTEEHFVDAEAIQPLSTPVYPAKALAAKAGLVMIGVKITVDDAGRVVDVAPSLLTFSTPTRYSEEFQEAVRLAVMQWHFHPAQRYSLRIFRDREGGGPPQELHRENTETFFDLAFTFTASGKVLPGPPEKQPER